MPIHPLVKYQETTSLLLRKYSFAFVSAIIPILEAEGAFTSNGGLNHRTADRGGLTKFGISQRAYPKLDIDNLTFEHAVQLFHRDYWRPMQCKYLHYASAQMLLDGAVQHGVPAMTMMVQRAIGAKPDGLFGPKTLALVEITHSNALVAQLIVKRARKYARICMNAPSQQANLNGWFNRLSHISTLCYIGVLEHG